MTLNDVMAAGKRVVGLCAGRHQLPVDEYIYGAIKDVLDFAGLLHGADKYVSERCSPLNVIVTGLTPCTAAVMYACACHGVDLTLWHYDREANDYTPQSFRFAITPQ